MKTQIRFALAGAMVCLACGCQTAMNTVEPAQPLGQKQMVTDKRVLNDASLARKVYVVGVNDGMTPGGLKQVQVELLNRTRSVQSFNYRFEWFDANGMLVASPASGMMSRRIEAGESLFVASVAPTPACQDFRLKLIESSN